MGIIKDLFRIKYDSVWEKNRIVLKYYQQIPKFAFVKKDILILSYDMGTGKTLTALNMITPLLRQTILAGNKYRKIHDEKIPPKVFVIGNNSTVNAFKENILEPCLNFIGERTHSRWVELRKTNTIESIKQYYMEREQALIQISDYIGYAGYIKLFNELYPSLANKEYTDLKLTTEYIRTGEIVPDPKTMEKYRNSVLIIDEFQKLYSNLTINSYGLAIETLMQHRKEYNIRFIMLSGTPLNTSVSELIHLLNIIRKPSETVYEEDDYFNFNELSTMRIPEFKAGKEKEIIKVLSPYFIYYASKKIDAKIIRKKNYMKLIGAPDYPIVYHVGDVHLNNFSLFPLRMKGMQLDAYREYIAKERTLFTDIHNESSSGQMHIYDAVLPKDLEKHKIFKTETPNGIIYIGDFLHINNIGNYSITCEAVINKVMECRKKKEKIAIYHNKITNFGLHQIAYALYWNGLTEFETRPSPKSICWQCGTPLNSHAKHCPKFIPMTYAILDGTLTKHRFNIIQGEYISPNNIFGNSIAVLLFSDVLATGGSLLNTNHMMILSRISNISKWEQITKRINRLMSHAALPPEKRFVNIYTCVIMGEERPEDSLSVKYYRVREKLNETIEKFIGHISKQSIGYELFNKPDISDTFIDDKAIRKAEEINELENFILSLTSELSPWESHNLWNRIKDIKRVRSHIVFENMTYDRFFSIIKFSKKFIVHEVNGKYYINPRDKLKEKSHELNKYNKYIYSSELINIGKGNIRKLIETKINKLHNVDAISSCVRHLREIIKYLNNDWGMVAGKEIFWKTMFRICNEYYEGDENPETFIRNHAVENRSYEKMKGFYYGDSIIYRDGGMKSVVVRQAYGLTPMNGYYIHASIGTSGSGGVWYLHLKIRKENENFKACMSLPDSVIEDVLELNERITSQKIHACLASIPLLAQKQLNIHSFDTMNTFLITPFQKL